MALALCALPLSKALSRLIASRSYSTCGRCGAILLCINRLGLEKLSNIRLVTPRGLIAEKKPKSDWFSRAYTTMTHNVESYGDSDNEEPKNSGLFLLYLVAGVVLCAVTNQDRKFVNAAKEGDIGMLRRLLSGGTEINSRHLLGWSALHAAVMNKQLSAVKFLVENGADVNIRDEFSTARRIARSKNASSFDVAAVRDRDFCSRINHNANYSGFTPLHYGVVVDDEEIIQYLLENGADPTIEDNAGYFPNDYCTNQIVKDLLAKYAVKAEQKKLIEKLEERRKYPLEDRLRQHIVGQEGPITTVAAAIRRREMGWGDNEHPLVFLFLGSSGIGKTELAKQVAKYIHKDNEKGFIRLDMSEYQEKHEVAKLIGAPPGYVGYDQGGQLTSRLRECSSGVVLFDEVDKAHPDVLTVLLQLFDEGRLTDGQGHTIDCKNAIFVMTSNLASDEIAQHGLQLRREASAASLLYHKSSKESDSTIEISREFKEQIVEPILKRHFLRDEFLGRINEMVYFLPFSRDELNKLVEQELVVWRERARERHSIQLTWSREVLDVLADGYNVKYGARSIHHEVERRVVNQLAAAYERQVIKQGSIVNLAVETNETSTPTIKLQVKETSRKETSNPL